ncbi:odorant receptor 94b-like [Trichogramma pretiosum]|uniref:odorant receptor 94b-like n=1 Tax=Trichogramma pretiosum TaxID=7493 RepID=UPI0006C9A7AC|nr:odorant receptor 94b-like [Trichogramma pretiosum]
MGQILELICMQGSVDEFSEVLYLTLTYVTLCLKLWNFLIHQEEMQEILDDLKSFHCEPKSTEEEDNCVEHHMLIIKLIRKIKAFFSQVIFFFFLSSLITLASSIYQLSKLKLASFEFFSIFFYFICILTQVFLYCWFGNELGYESRAITETYYMGNWLDLSNKDRRHIWFLNSVSRNSKNISFHGLCALSMETFLWIVKTSYAAFNLLQRFCEYLREKMDIIPANFRLLQFCGIWTETDSDKNILKSIWGFSLITVIFYFTIVQIIKLYFFLEDLEELIDVMFLTVTYILLCLKILNFIMRRQSVLHLLKMFRHDMYKACSPEEEKILKMYSKSAYNMFRIILILSQSTGVFFCLLPFVTLDPENFELPFKTYQFYDDETTLGFSVTYVIQLVALIFGIFINVSMDTMIYGFILLTSGQYELVSYRFQESISKNDEFLLKQTITHYGMVKKTVKRIQTAFMIVIAPLFFLSSLTLCASIFQLSQNDVFTLEFLGFTMYLSCMLCQVFLYCKYGEELKSNELEFKNNIYKSNWTSLQVNQQKLLTMMLILANNVEAISWKGQFTLSLDTFVWLMKTSYTAFNLIHKTSG